MCRRYTDVNFLVLVVALLILHLLPIHAIALCKVYLLYCYYSCCLTMFSAPTAHFAPFKMGQKLIPFIVFIRHHIKKFSYEMSYYLLLSNKVQYWYLQLQTSSDAHYLLFSDVQMSGAFVHTVCYVSLFLSFAFYWLCAIHWCTFNITFGIVLNTML